MRAVLLSLAVLFLATTATVGLGQTAPQDTLRLRPSEFPGLPPAIAAWLEARGNFIPQTGYTLSGVHSQPENVLQGEFYRAGQTDWAVMAVDGDSLRVWLFPEGKVDNPEVLLCDKEEPFKDNPLEGRRPAWIADPHIGPEAGYFFYIEKIDTHSLAEAWKHGWGMPAQSPDFTHEGIIIRQYDSTEGWRFYHHCDTWLIISIWQN